MDNSLIQKIRDEIARTDSIAIAVGRNPSIDDMGAALSLYLLLRDANKKVTIASPTQPIVELSSLVGIDKVGSKLEGQDGDLTVSFPYVEGEIEKVSYTLENGLLNIIVKSAGQGLSFDERDVRFNKGGGGGGAGGFGMLFVIGTPRLSDLADLISSDQLRNTKIVNIDNKQDNETYGDIVVVSPSFSSVSEIIGDLVLALGFRVDKDVAQNLMSGIMYATQNFQEQATSPLAFEIASLLMRSGAKREAPSQSRNQLPPRQNRDARSPDRQQSNPRQQRQPQQDEDQHRQQGNDKRYAMNDSQRNDDNQEQVDDQNAPTDWLAPKVYKGSSNF